MGPLIGSSVQRVEDGRLVQGRGRYVDDLSPPGTLHASFLRSPHAHARIRSVDLARARCSPGIVAAYDGVDLLAWCRPIRATITVPGLIATDWPVLATDRARFVGEGVAVVIAESRALAEDALEVIEVDYEPLEAVVGDADGVRAGSPLVHEAAGTNILFQLKAATGNVDEAFSRADLVLSEEFQTQRATGVPIEPRGYLAQPDPMGDGIILWSSTQVPHIIRTVLAELLDLDEARIQVVAPDVGGGFGVKGQLFPEECVVCAAARALHRPVKWIETRREHFLASIHSREHHYVLEGAFSADGRLRALRAKISVDAGAYSVYPYTISTEPAHAASLVPGPYDVQDYACESIGVATNKCVIAPYRGVSRPTANFATERLMDIAARRLSLDPAEIRLRNLVRDDQFPYRTATGLTLDSGRYHAAFTRALEVAGYDEFRRQQAETRAAGRWLGVGSSFLIESSAGGAASFLARGMPVAGFDMASVRVSPTGKVEVATSAASQGQSHQTVFAQIAADVLVIPFDDIRVLGGDTRLVPYGTGTFGSRSAVMSGGAVQLAAREIRIRAVQIAAHLLEVAPDDIALDASGFTIAGSDRRLTWPEVARAAHIGTSRLPANIKRGLEATASHDLPAHHNPCSYGVHVATVEVDPETGTFETLRYVIVEDCGTAINPMVVEGQIHGAFAQGFGTAVIERLVYDGGGQLVTGSLMDYALPRATDVPTVQLEHMQTPSPYTLTGAKGMAEGASVAPPAALANAISDALTPLGIEIRSLPLSSERIWSAIRAAGEHVSR